MIEIPRYRVTRKTIDKNDRLGWVENFPIIFVYHFQFLSIIIAYHFYYTNIVLPNIIAYQFAEICLSFLYESRVTR